jgi:hypothetical protein
VHYPAEGEGVLLLRVGTFSSSLFIGVKYGNDLRYAILQTLKAKSDSIQRPSPP